MSSPHEESTPPEDLPTSWMTQFMLRPPATPFVSRATHREVTPSNTNFGTENQEFDTTPFGDDNMMDTSTQEQDANMNIDPVLLGETAERVNRFGGIRPPVIPAAANTDRRLVEATSLRQFAALQASAASLTSEQTATVLAMSERSLAEMLISTHVAVLKYQNDLFYRMLRLLTLPILLDYDKPRKTRLRNHVAAALLAIDVRAYVKGVLDQMMEYFTGHLEVLALNSSVKDDPVDMQLVRASVSNELSTQRSWIKSKLDLGIKKKEDIYTLTSALLSTNVKPRTLHFARFAFLRLCASQFKEHPTSKTKSGKFWDFVDDRLAEARAALKCYPATEYKRREAEFFASILSTDKALYAQRSGALARQTFSDEDGPEWQREMEKTVSRFIVDDDDVSEPPAALASQ
ncbi:hypothetical protein EIP86_001887 [Pleurotus ostreatoroseus]|nr:hypothetical protein EIP86_001887 [Pleurotus ostreatoroseus]